MAPENKKAAGNAVQAETSKQSTPKTKTPKSLKPEPTITKKLLNKSKAKKELKPEPKITQSSNTEEQLKPKPKITKKLPKQSSNTKEQLKPEPKITKKLPNQSSNTKEELKPVPKVTEKLPNQSSNTKEQVKPEPEITKKLPNQSNDKEESKRPQITQGSGAGHQETNKEDFSGKKGNDNAQVKGRTDDIDQEKIVGIIFMCNANTKADCFRYMVMGLPGGKRELVATIKPGLKLFLFDFDAKLLYGIFKAASAGGWRLEPAAFNGSYPAQVRFEVDKDCLPLPEATFKKAITANSGGDRKFNTELTGKQVKILTNLFEPCHKAASNVNPPILNPQAIPVPRVPLRPELLVRGPNGLNDPSRRNESAPVKGEDVNPLAFGEKEYRMFGLKKPSAIFEPVPAPAPAYAVGREAYYPYSLPLTRGTGYYPSGMGYPSDLSRGVAGESEYRRPEQLTAQPATYPSYPYSRGENEVEYARREAESSRSHSSHAAAALSDYNKAHQQLGTKGEYGSLPVSSRYSFAGPSFSHR